jgi:hypothetical protein
MMMTIMMVFVPIVLLLSVIIIHPSNSLSLSSASSPLRGPVSVTRRTTALSSTALPSTPSASSPPSPLPPQIKQTIQNLLSISTHLQNPDLYSPSWANACSVVTSTPKKKNKNNSDYEYSVKTSRKVQQGELLTLYPVHAIGIKTQSNVNIGTGTSIDNQNDVAKSNTKGMGGITSKKKSTKRNAKQQQQQMITRNKNTFLEAYDYLIHDSKWDFDLTVPKMKLYQHEVQIPLLTNLNSNLNSNILGVNPLLSNYDKQMYIQTHPQRKLLPGWYGHLIPTKTSSELEFAASRNKSMKNQPSTNNCILVPIPCSIPLCGIVATRDIEKGEEIIRQAFDEDSGNEKEKEEKRDMVIFQYVKKIVQRYTAEISELGSFYQMAFPKDNNENNNVSSLPSFSCYQSVISESDETTYRS